MEDVFSVAIQTKEAMVRWIMGKDGDKVQFYRETTRRQSKNWNGGVG